MSGSNSNDIKQFLARKNAAVVCLDSCPLGYTYPLQLDELNKNPQNVEIKHFRGGKMTLLEEYQDRYQKPPTELAKQILFELIDDLTCRKGFDWVENCDLETREEILETNLENIQNRLKKTAGPNRKR